MHETLTNKSKITNEDIVTWLNTTSDYTKEILSRINSIGIKTDADRAVQEDAINLLTSCTEISATLGEDKKLTSNQKIILVNMLQGVLADLEKGIIEGSSTGINNYIAELKLL